MAEQAKALLAGKMKWRPTWMEKSSAREGDGDIPI
jgi:hypothetical protein